MEKNERVLSESQQHGMHRRFELLALDHLKVLKVLWTPVSGQGVGGVPRNPDSESTFQNEFCAEMRITDKIIKKQANKQTD